SVSNLIDRREILLTEERRIARDVHLPSHQPRRGCVTHISRALPAHRARRGDAQRQGAPRQAVLPAPQGRPGSQDQGEPVTQPARSCTMQLQLLERFPLSIPSLILILSARLIFSWVAGKRVC